MANLIYLTLQGEKMGLISEGCGTEKSIGNKWQKGHENQIFVYETSNIVTRDDNISFHPFTIRKPIDKATPLLLQALNEKDILECIFEFYRVSPNGGNELYFKISLKNAHIQEISSLYPSSMTHNELQPQENVQIKFATMIMDHISANTSSWATWKVE